MKETEIGEQGDVGRSGEWEIGGSGEVEEEEEGRREGGSMRFLN